MKKNIIYLAALAMMAAACSNEDNTFVTNPEDDVTGEVRMITETITATNGDAGASTRSVVDADAKFAWSTGDEIAVHVSDGKYYNTEALAESNSGNKSAVFTITYPDGKKRDAIAVYPASIVAESAANYGQEGHTLDVTLPSSYTLAEVSGTTTPCPMIAENTGSDWTFYQLCGLLRLTVKGIPSDAIGMVIQFPGKKVNGTFSVTNPSSSEPTIDTSDPATGEDKITITFAAGQSEATVNIPLPTGDYEDVFITPIGSNTKVAAVRHIKAGKYTTARAHAGKLTTTMVSFSVGESKKVVFAPGNLQATTTDYGANWTWHFAEHQYDYIGNKAANTTVNGNGTVSENGTVDLFGYSTSTTHFGIKYSRTESEYSDDFEDWGNNIIGQYSKKFWKTLSSVEWQYVVGEDNYRSTDSKVADVTNAMCTKATVNGIKGFILFPDNYDYDSGTPIANVEWKPDYIGYTNMGSPSAVTGWGATISTTAAWEALEAAGCVFLPAASVRYDNRVIYFEGCSFGGDYATPKGYYSSRTKRDANTIYTLRFSDAGFDPNEYFNISYGYSVRLVHEL